MASTSISLEESNRTAEFFQFHDAGVLWYYEWLVKFVQPVTIPLGLVSNAVSLALLPRRSVRINLRCKYLYMFSLIADTLLIVFKDLVDGYLSDGLYWLSDGRFYLDLEFISCHVFRSARFILEILSNYSITFIVIERYFSLIYPLKLEANLSLRRLIALHLSVVLPLALVNALSVVLVFGQIETPGTVHNTRCIVLREFGLIGVFVGVFAQQVQYSLHALLNAVFNALTLRKVWESRAAPIRRSAFGLGGKAARGGGNGGLLLSAEMRLTAAIVAISALRIVLYVPCAITWSMYDYYAMAERLETQLDFDLFRHSANLSHAFLLLTGLARIANFLLLLLEPSFRRSLVCSCRRRPPSHIRHSFGVRPSLATHEATANIAVQMLPLKCPYHKHQHTHNYSYQTNSAQPNNFYSSTKPNRSLTLREPSLINYNYNYY